MPREVKNPLKGANEFLVTLAPLWETVTSYAQLFGVCMY